MRPRLRSLLPMILLAAGVAALPAMWRATRPLDSEIARERREREALLQENLRLRVEQQALESTLVEIAFHEATAARLQSRGLSVYLMNGRDDDPIMQISEFPAEVTKTGPSP